jgi:hypothetical protein
MTEAEWLASSEAYQPLIHVRKYASVRKLRLVAAAYARWLQSLPAYELARPCADLIEEVADEPKSQEELELRLWGLPSSDWRLSHALGNEDIVGQAVSKLVFFADGAESPHLVHGKMIGLLQEVFGNPFRPVTPDSSWLTSTVVKLAQGVYDERAFERMPILADALEDAGCDNKDVLEHCRGPGPHVRGCWVVDLLLGKAG